MDANTSVENAATAIDYSSHYGWKFTPIADLYVDGHDFGIWTGKLEYDHPAFTIIESIKIKSWIFTLEQNIQSRNKSVWFVCAFRNRAHYSFGSIKNATQKEFIHYCVKVFMPMLYSTEDMKVINNTVNYTILPLIGRTSPDEVEPNSVSEN